MAETATAKTIWTEINGRYTQATAEEWVAAQSTNAPRLSFLGEYWYNHMRGIVSHTRPAILDDPDRDTYSDSYVHFVHLRGSFDALCRATEALRFDADPGPSRAEIDRAADSLAESNGSATVTIYADAAETLRRMGVVR